MKLLRFGVNGVPEEVEVGLIVDSILTGETYCCPDLEVLIDEFGNVLEGEF